MKGIKNERGKIKLWKKLIFEKKTYNFTAVKNKNNF